MNIVTMAIKRIVLAGLLGFGALALAGGVSAEPAQAGANPQILFGYHQTNFAWGAIQRGWFVDGQGNVKRYNLTVTERSTWREPDEAGYMDKLDLEFNYGLATKTVAVVPEAELKEKTALAADLGTPGEVSQPVHVAYDAGNVELVCYLWDDGRQQYRKVLLFRSGDYHQTNHNPKAQELVDWLRGLNQRLVP